MILQAEDICLCYDRKTVLKNVNIDIQQGETVAIVGPNGSGKSTLLKVLSRTLKPQKGKVLLDSKNISEMNTKAIARRLAMLPQIRSVPGDFTVETLVGYGRYPHLGFVKKLKAKDLEIVDWAIDKTGLDELRHRYVETLSGGERQRAWIAMALAQKSDIMLLDEPTTFLDISYQLETLELLKDLNEKLGLTIVMVLHDLNQAVRYADKIFALLEGSVYKHSSSSELLTGKLLQDVFRIEGDILTDRTNKFSYFIPRNIIRR